MRRIIIMAAFVLLLAPASTVAAKGSTATVKAKVAHRFETVVKKHGRRAAGRDILHDGVRFRWVSEDGRRAHTGVRAATHRELAKHARQLAAILRPPPPLLVRTVGAPALAPAGAQTSSVAAGGTLQRIASCESGGDPGAVSPDGLYRGKYQFDYGTWGSVGGSGDPAQAPEAEQDRRAATLYARRGSQPWPVCG